MTGGLVPGAGGEGGAGGMDAKVPTTDSLVARV